MGKRGPQPKPSKVLEIRGSWRAEGRAATELKIVPETPEPPGWLSPGAVEEWYRVVPPLAAIKILTKQDRAMLAVHCHAWGEFETSAMVLQAIESGERAEHKGTIVDHPRVVMGRAIERLIKTADRFGFSAAARARWTAGPNSDEDEKPKAKSRFFPSGPATKAV